jgi:hypothetical protein
LQRVGLSVDGTGLGGDAHPFALEDKAFFCLCPAQIPPFSTQQKRDKTRESINDFEASVPDREFVHNSYNPTTQQLHVRLLISVSNDVLFYNQSFVYLFGKQTQLSCRDSRPSFEYYKL